MTAFFKERNNQKIIVLFHGGLGNQLYQYCFYRWIQERYSDIEILADVSEYTVIDCHQGFELTDVFPNIHINKASSIALYKIYGELPRCYGGIGRNYVEDMIRKPLNKWIFHINSNIVYTEHGDISYEDILREIETGKKYFSGYWQDTYYFLDNIKILRQELRFKDIDDEINLKQLDHIQNSVSVAVHVRRGDYISAGLPLLGSDYYRRAINIICENVENPLFFIFSDDKNYIEKEFGWLKNKVIIKNNIAQNSYKDMQLMSCCKHNIVANSTFSIWGGYLNSNKNKMVICPSNILLRKQACRGWIIV